MCNPSCSTGFVGSSPYRGCVEGCCGEIRECFRPKQRFILCISYVWRMWVSDGTLVIDVKCFLGGPWSEAVEAENASLKSSEHCEKEHAT